MLSWAYIVIVYFTASVASAADWVQPFGMPLGTSDLVIQKLHCDREELDVRWAEILSPELVELDARSSTAAVFLQMEEGSAEWDAKLPEFIEEATAHENKRIRKKAWEMLGFSILGSIAVNQMPQSDTKQALSSFFGMEQIYSSAYLVMDSFGAGENTKGTVLRLLMIAGFSEEIQGNFEPIRRFHEAVGGVLEDLGGSTVEQYFYGSTYHDRIQTDYLQFGALIPAAYIAQQELELHRSDVQKRAENRLFKAFVDGSTELPGYALILAASQDVRAQNTVTATELGLVKLPEGIATKKLPKVIRQSLDAGYEVWTDASEEVLRLCAR